MHEPHSTHARAANNLIITNFCAPKKIYARMTERHICRPQQHVNTLETKNSLTHTACGVARLVSARARQVCGFLHTVLHVIRAQNSYCELIHHVFMFARLARAHCPPPSSTTMNLHKCQNYGPTPWPSFFSSPHLLPASILNVTLYAVHRRVYMLIRQNCGTRLTMYLYRYRH